MSRGGHKWLIPIAVAAVAIASGARSATLTGVCLFTAITNGTSYWPAYVWDTRPGPPYHDFWVARGYPYGDPDSFRTRILNGPGEPIAAPLRKGTNYFTVFQSDPGGLVFVGLNLFLNGNPATVISAKTWGGTPSFIPPFTSNTSTQTHGRMDDLPAFPVPAAGTLVYSNPLERVTLTDFYLTGFGVDRVGYYQPGIRDGLPDFTCVIALNVETKVVSADVRVSEIELCWNSLSNQTYRIEYLSDFSDSWTVLGSMQGDGGAVCQSASIDLGSLHKIFRVASINGTSPSSAPLLTIRPSALTLCWDSETDKTYQLQYSFDVSAEGWHDFGSLILPTPPRNCSTLSIVRAAPVKFYRVVEYPLFE